MSSRPRRRRALALGAVAGSLLVALAVSVALAGSGDPAGISVTRTGTLSVSASGSWTWPEMTTAKKLSFAGFAIDWGDVSSGNAIPKPGGGAYHIGDGTAATNFVLHPTTPAQGDHGTWGPVSHTYQAAGMYTVCVVVYDLGEVTPFKATGYHGLRAGGPERNTDNSVEQNGDITNNCMTVDVTEHTSSPSASESVGGETATPVVTPTPSESVHGATGTPPISTPPPTSANAGGSGDGSLPLVPVVVLLSLVLFGLFSTRRALRSTR